MPLNIDIQQILLHLFNFVILAGGLYLLLYRPVRDFMDKRTSQIREKNDEAEKKMNDARELESRYSAKLADAENEIARRKQEAAAETEKTSGEILDKARSQADKILSDARAEAEAERAKIIDSAQKDIADLAVSAAGKIVKQTMDSTYGEFLDAAAREDTAAREGKTDGRQEN